MRSDLEQKPLYCPYKYIKGFFWGVKFTFFPLNNNSLFILMSYTLVSYLPHPLFHLLLSLLFSLATLTNLQLAFKHLLKISFSMKSTQTSIIYLIMALNYEAQQEKNLWHKHSFYVSQVGLKIEDSQLRQLSGKMLLHWHLNLCTHHTQHLKCDFLPPLLLEGEDHVNPMGCPILSNLH